MSADEVLLILRVLSTALLLGFLGGVLVVLWRDFRSTARLASEAQRQRGRLVVIGVGDNVDSVASAPPPVDTLEYDGMGGLAAAAELVGMSFPLLPFTTLGRAPTNTIVLQDTFCSQDHALVLRRGGQWWLEDRGSSNGTTLNGEAVQQPVVVSSGDVIGIGRVLLRVELAVD